MFQTRNNTIFIGEIADSAQTANFSSVRSVVNFLASIAFWAAIAVVGFNTVSSADTIILKNGRRIIAESVSRQDGKIVYEGEDGRISIPEAVVDRIEKDDAKPHRSRAAAPDLPAAIMAKSVPVQFHVPTADIDGVIIGDTVNEARLDAVAALAAKGPTERQSATNAYLAAAFESERPRYSQAATAAIRDAYGAYQFSPMLNYGEKGTRWWRR